MLWVRACVWIPRVKGGCSVGCPTGLQSPSCGNFCQLQPEIQLLSSGEVVFQKTHPFFLTLQLFAVMQNAHMKRDCPVCPLEWYLKLKNKLVLFSLKQPCHWLVISTSPLPMTIIKAIQKKYVAVLAEPSSVELSCALKNIYTIDLVKRTRCFWKDS